MTPPHAVLLGVTVSAALLTQQIAAQAQSPGAGLDDRWSISMFRFWTQGTTDNDLLAALTDQQFKDTIPASGSFGGGVTSPVPTPISRRGPELGWALAVGYRVTEHVDVELAANRAVRVADVLGFHLETGTQLNSHASLAAWSASMGLRFGPVRLAAGPAHYRTRVQTEDAWFADQYVPAEHDDAGGFGALLRAGIAVPVGSWSVVETRGEFRWVGRRPIGPFESIGWTGERLGFSRQNVGFDHGVVMVGVGFRR